jgi:hypothetical protein
MRSGYCSGSGLTGPLLRAQVVLGADEVIDMVKSYLK